ncbi:PfpI family Intracellular protease [Thecamonas trahens ATCC 50062]|uniref:PfpI family Intracellular protease n=1 Tax=Thecamonas trahens ATCC 50062 TaxID=461836 RepID=A0A0L0D9K1_THETB|nr:PfpI family Intracellular protease [Thecamonas trahens ATCC 50062]KNC48920.1 PfpI family Intracellular protease [Thecamonas trahens ATCC 50062]|eukprot:XP_013758337.1 PfpI family Intracellular protease [Thecamonas trahens ATCC 50062]
MSETPAPTPLRKAVVLADDGYEDLELHYPRLRLEEAGFDVVVAAREAGLTSKSKFGYWAISNAAFADVDPSDVAVLVVPGGLLCPDRLRRYPEALGLVAGVAAAGGVVGMICHGPWVGISAKILDGVRATCFSAIKDDVINAGATYVADERVVVDADARIVTAQTPNDLPGFMRGILSLLDD